MAEPIRLWNKEKETSNTEPIRLWNKEEPERVKFGDVFEYAGWVQLEKEGKMTPTLQKLKDAGFGPPKETKEPKEPEYLPPLDKSKQLDISAPTDYSKSTPAIASKGLKTIPFVRVQSDIMKPIDEYITRQAQREIKLEEKVFDTSSDPLNFFDRWTMIQEDPVKLVGFSGDAVEATELFKLLNTARKLEKGEDVYESDIRELQKYILTLDKDKTFGYKTLDIVANAVPFMQEMFVTWGIYQAGAVPAKKATKGLLERLTKKKFKGILAKALTKYGIEATGIIAGGTTRFIPAGFTDIIEGTIRKQLHGELTGDEEAVWESGIKAMGETWVEFTSEESGRLFGMMGADIKGHLLKKGLFKAFVKANPTKGTKVINEFFDKTGYQYPWNEMLEERVADVGHDLLHSIGMSDQDFVMPSMEQAMEQVALEFTAFSVPGIAGKTVGTAINELQTSQAGLGIKFVGKEPKKDIPKIKLKEIKAEEIKKGKPIRLWKKETKPEVPSKVAEGVKKEIIPEKGVIPKELEKIDIVIKENEKIIKAGTATKLDLKYHSWLKSARDKIVKGQSLTSDEKFMRDLAVERAEKITPTIPKELEPLAKEAKKYKSAESFVEEYKPKRFNESTIEINDLSKIQANDLGDLLAERIFKDSNTISSIGITKNLTFPTNIKSFEANPNEIKLLFGKDRGTSDVAIKKLTEAFQKGDDIPAVYIYKNRFLDGGNRVEAAIKAGKDKIKVFDLDEVIKDTIQLGKDEGYKIVNTKNLTDIPSILKSFYTQATKPVIEVKVEKPVEKVKEKKYLEGIQKDIIKKIHSKLQNRAYIKSITKQEAKAVQTEIINALEKSNLDAHDKAKFIRAVKNIQTIEQLEKKLPKILERITELEQAELSRSLQTQLDKELKYVKPVKVGQKRVAKYDYQTNKFLEGLRRDNKLNQEQAQSKLDKIPTEGLSELQKIEARFLSLKANGAKASVLLHEQVLADIRYLKEIGEIAKDEADFIKRVEKQEKVDKILDGIDKQKEGISALKKFKSIYISSIANLYSTINTIAGKEIADKYDYGIYQTNSQYNFSEQVEKATTNAKRIYDVKSDRQLTNVFVKDLAPTNWDIVDTTGLKTEINRFNLIDIYNAIKNDLGKARYYNAFGETQVDALLQNLTQEDVKMADYLMKDVQGYRDILNKRSIETTGRDLGEVENYWPSTSEFEVDFYDDIKIQGETPSAMKERSKSSKIFPRIDNAWLKFQKHIAQGEHVKTLSKRYEELKNLFSNRAVKHTIKEKFSNETYVALMDHIETFSLNKRTQSLDVFSGIYNTALNNWVKAKIASPTVFARQLISSIYSIENVGAKNFLKYQSEAIRNPRRTFNYMWKNIPFLSTRFKQGYSEALQDAIKGTNKLKVGMDSISKYVTLMTRGGDITAIVINGYPIIKTEMAKHGNMQKAIDEFQKFTEKTQQSGTIANLSRLQRERSAFARTFFRFKNTTNQLLRLQTDATIQYINKQISGKEFATKTALYSVYTPMMYVLIGFIVREGWKKIFGTDDEEYEKSLSGDILAQIIVQPFQALPLLDMAAENAYAEIRKRITGKSYYFGEGMFSYPLLDDIETGWSKLKKKEPTTADFLRVFSLLQEPVTGIPTETFLRYYGYTQRKGGPTLKGSTLKSNTLKGSTLKSKKLK